MEELKQQVKQALEEGRIEGFLGLKIEGEQAVPLFITKENIGDIESLVSSDKSYPVGKILLKIADKYPGKKLGVMVNTAEERALTELFKAKQLDDANIVSFKVSEPEVKKDDYSAELLAKIEQMPVEERFNFWMSQFAKCIKCYGCRNACPVCYCEECTLEDKRLIPENTLPTDMPGFHLIKAIHMADRCIDCGLCENACPAGIPLRAIYKHMGKVMKEMFDYAPGESVDDKSPLGVLEEGSKVIGL